MDQAGEDEGLFEDEVRDNSLNILDGYTNQEMNITYGRLLQGREMTPTGLVCFFAIKSRLIHTN